MAVILVELVGVQDAFVGAGLVEETLALGVDLQERLAAHPEEAALAVLGLVTAGHCVGLQGGTVEYHHAVGVVKLCAHPDAGLDAVAGSAGDGTVAAHDGQVLRLQSFHHVIVQGVAAGADDDALGSVDADVLAVLVLSDDADHAVVLLHQLHHGGVVHELDAETRGIIGQDLCTVQGLAGAVVGTGPAGRVAGSKVDVAVAVVVAAGLVPQLHAAVSQTIAVPVDGLSGLLAEQAHQALVDVTGCDLGHLGDVIELVDLGAPFLLVTAVDGAQVVADAAAGHLVDDQGLCAVLGSAAGCKQAARAAADHQNFGLEGVHDVAVSDDGSGAQPLRGAVVHGLGGLVGGGQTHGLLNAACGCLLHGLAGDGGTGNAVDLRALGGHQCFLEVRSGIHSQCDGLLGGVHLHFGDGTVAEGHGDGHGTGTGLGSGVGARGIDARVAGGSRGAVCLAVVAGSQTGSRHAGHGSRRSDLQKALTREFFHVVLLFLLGTSNKSSNFLREKFNFAIS